MLTFLSTLDETLGRGIGWSVSPMSAGAKRSECQKLQSLLKLDVSVILGRCETRVGAEPVVFCELTFEHLLDEYGSLSDVAIDGELLVVGGSQADHFGDFARCEWSMDIEEGWIVILGQ